MTLLRPLRLIFSALAYFLGIASADYLGATISPLAIALGLGWALFAQTSMNLLAEVFRPINEPLNGLFGAERVYLRDRLLLVSIGLLGLAAGCAYLLYLLGSIHMEALILLALSLLIVLAYAVPPLKLARRGFGELLLAAHIGYIFPSLGFVLQSGEFHRLLPILALPVTMLALAYFLILDFSTFADDIKYERVTLLTRLGWQRAIPLHHGLVIFAFLLLAAAPLLNISAALLWPAFLALPFAILQIVMLHNISLGARPLWKPLATLSAATFALTVYLLTFSLFLR
ncbi:MAG: 1,4-dihydroxy-2-naphthoate octaprenyltransferase [Anaerolineales bacterium]|nr:1,4-dihydroxy-2-naphthoate octaprenyltransferase [Anaerolineales bacterium]